MPTMDELQAIIVKFQKSRRNDETRNYVKNIIGILEKARDTDPEDLPGTEIGWVRVKTLFDELVGKDIPNQTTFYRLLNDLHEAQIIEKREKAIPGEKGRTPTYYRIPTVYRTIWFMSREEVIEKYNKNLSSSGKLNSELWAAEQLLKECHKGEDGYDAKHAIQNYLNEYDRLRPEYYKDGLKPGTDEQYLGFLIYLEKHRKRVMGEKLKS